MQIQRFFSAAALMALAGTAQAGGPSIDRFTIDSGGGTSAGGDWSLTGTIGQPDAGPVLVGADLSLEPGFWTFRAEGEPPCPADVAPPFGILDLADISAFTAGFLTMDPISDIAEPFGVLDLIDINAFVTSFLAGCP
jgi:hypothetical protein